MAKYPEQFTFPGAIDFHVHVREPSPINNAETFRTATEAALFAGNIAIADISNTPGWPTWTLDRVLQKQSIICHKARGPVGMWFGSQPEEDNIKEFASVGPYVLGLKVFAHPSTGNDRHYEPEDFEKIFAEWHKNNPDLPIAIHPGKDNVEGFTELGEKTDHHVHFFHSNNPEDVELIVAAQKRGAKTTCGVCPHHVTMTEEDATDWYWRMQPPLVGPVDSEKLMYQLIHGQIDALETDHAPHPKSAKEEANRNNPEGIEDPSLKRCYGVRSLSIALPLMLHEFEKRDVPLERFIEVTSTKPAEIIGVKISPKTSVTYTMEEFEITKSDDGPTPEGVEVAPSPFLGRMALGRVLNTKIGGFSVIENGKLIAEYPKFVKRGVTI